MIVLFVSSGNSRFGINPIVKNQGESLEMQGVSVDYFTIQGKGIRSYINNVPKLRGILKANHYDLIHAHYGFSGLIAYLAKRKEKIVVSFMGSDLLSRSMLNSLTLKIQRFFAQNLYDHNITKAQNLKSKLNAKNLSVIPNGVNFDRFFPIDQNTARQKLNLSLDKKIILFAANPARHEKNFQLACQAVKLLSYDDIELLTIFDKSQEQLNYYYNACDLLLLTSLYEGSPNVVKEAMACNLPIVATNVGDVKEVIGETEGSYIATFTPENVADKIRDALAFGKRTNGREAVQFLDSNKIAVKIKGLYKTVLYK